MDLSTHSVRREDGQALAFTAVALTAVVAIAAFVIDVGFWFRVDRQAQTIADAAALAGAQALPQDTDYALALADEYAEANGGSDVNVTFSSEFFANDTISVQVSQGAPTFFARIFGLDSVTVGAKATARSSAVYAANSIAPIVVNDQNPDLQCYLAGGGESTCYDGVPETFELVNYHEPGTGDAGGQFGLLNLDGSATGTAATTNLVDWIMNGYPGYIEPGPYYGAPSAKYNSGEFRDAMESKYYENCLCELLFPIWSGAIEGSGSNAVFNIIGWVSFRLESFDPNGSTATITGHFTEITWDGISASSGSPPNFGARTISLIE